MVGREEVVGRKGMKEGERADHLLTVVLFCFPSVCIYKRYPGFLLFSLMSLVTILLMEVVMQLEQLC